MNMWVHGFCAILVALTIRRITYVLADFEHLEVEPERVILPAGFETVLTCDMNIEPDQFQWKFYPSTELYNGNANIQLSNPGYRLIPENVYSIKGDKSVLPLKLKEEDVGDYQCLAYYGASVVASVPWRVTLPRMGPMPRQETISVSVQAGNTVSWRCKVPESNPPAYMYYQKGDQYVSHPKDADKIGSMILPNVSLSDTNTYRCTTTNMFEKKMINAVLNLEVLHNGPMKAPSFISYPLTKYTALKDAHLFLECSAVGNPVPKVSWTKLRSQMPSNRTEIVPGGLIIRNVTSNDDGVYVCTHTNSQGKLSQEITVNYNEEPSIDCSNNTIKIKQGENLDFSCEVKGVPEPQIVWFLNGFSVLNDSEIEAMGNKIYFRPVEKRHAGNLQIFARNIVKTVYSSVSIRVFPIATSIDEMTTPMHGGQRHKNKKSPNTKRPPKHKPAKMIPPSRPVISRVNDETVVVRWNVTTNNGLPINFFKIQYKDLGLGTNNKDGYRSSSEWNTANSEIPSAQRAHEITELTPDHIYKFRVAAVYLNDACKLSPLSKKFHLQTLDFEQRNPLPLCKITRIETVNHTAVQIYWQCNSFNVPIDGFYINYILATRAGDDYMMTPVEGQDVRSSIIDHLQPDTSYDFKMQSFTQKLAGEFSPLMKGRTAANPAGSVTTVTVPPTSKNIDTSAPDNNIYVIGAVSVIVFGLLTTGVILLFVCRRWQKNKLSGEQDKPAVEHHIQADGSDYVVEPKPLHRTNGCALPGNRITITSNPLADADKNPTVIEMRNLANNNVRHQSERLDATLSENADGHLKHQHKKKLRRSREDCSTGSNYV
ncbi:interference hedgehog isoform X1 [Euwallacea similis]|uniref:interference hedgehog isoform X1 n=1 Tax=Euwallacea similis TaxID=1736056 RepID=UPI00344D0853